MPIPRKVAPKKAETNTPAPTPAVKEAAPTPAKKSEGATVLMVRSRKIPLHHPYQNIMIKPWEATQVTLDSWVQCQLDAKVIERA